jgi:hypothetical protein
MPASRRDEYRAGGGETASCGRRVRYISFGTVMFGDKAAEAGLVGTMVLPLFDAYMMVIEKTSRPSQTR